MKNSLSSGPESAIMKAMPFLFVEEPEMITATNANIRKLKTIDLFSGAGGLSLGFERAGFTPVFAVESDKHCACSYTANFPDAVVFNGDVRTLESYSRHPADLVIGGPPCQGFSPLGKMSAGIDRRNQHCLMNSLCMEILRAAEDVGARAFVMENVPQFLKSEEFRLFLKRAEKLGFNVAHGVLKAEDYGVPQRRRRGFTVGIRNGKASLPRPSGETKTVRDAIGDLPLNPTGDNLHEGRNPTAKSLERYALIPPGGNRFDLMRKRPDICPTCWLNKPTGSTDVFGRLEWDKPALTIRTEFFKPEKGRYLHPRADRPITHREAARLQTFPDDFIFCGGKTDIALQIGNAVPPRLAERVAEHVMKLLESTEPLIEKMREPEKCCNG